MRILAIGELNPDLILQGYRIFPTPGKEITVDDLHLTMGSAAAICAMGLAKLGNQVAFLSKAGDDIWCDFCLRLLEERGIDTSRVIKAPELKTGITVSISSSKDRALVTYPGAMLQFRAADIDEGEFESFRHLHMSSYYLQDALRPGFKQILAAATRHGLTTSLDPGYDPTEQWGGGILETLDEVDVFFPNEVELAGISGRSDPVEALRALENGRTRTVAKFGAAGSLALEQGQPVRAASIQVEPVDTTGAGDSFNAGFLHAWLRGYRLGEALRFAGICGALSTLGLGGVAAQPGEEEVLRRMELECPE